MKTALLCILAAGCVESATETSNEPTIDPTAAQGTLRVRDWRGDVYEVPVVEQRDRAIYDGDVDLGPWSRTQLRAYASPVSISNRWSANTVRYKFRSQPAGCNGDPSCSCPTVTAANCEALTSAEQQEIRDAMDEYTRLTGIVFVESDAPPFIALTGWDLAGESRTFGDDANQNFGHTKLIAFADKLIDPMDDTKAYRTIIHELGHSLGLAHEQKRGDVAGTVELNPICMTRTTPFESAPGMTYLSPFDVDSMMIYSSFSFSRDDECPTMLGVNGSQSSFHYTNDTGVPITVLFDGVVDVLPPGGSRNFSGHVLERTEDFSKEDLNALHQMYPRTLGSHETGDRLGEVAVTGDFNGDGYRDLAVAAPHEGMWGHPTSGAVFIYRGTYTGLAPWTVIEADSTGASTQADDRFGTGLAAVDLDDDGNDELLVGAPNKRTNGTNRSGGVYVFDTKRAGFELRDYLFPNDLGYGNGVDDDFGFAIDVAKEHGATRILVGAPGTSSSAGRVYTLRYDSAATRHNVSGTGTLVPVGHWGDSQPAGAKFGTAIASGQLDSDDYDDVVIGAPGASGGGKVIVLKGGSSFTVAGSITKPGSDSLFYDERFGRSLKLGKFRNLASGKRQVAVSAPWESTGRVYILDVTVSSSSVTLDSSMVLFSLSTGTSEFGYDLAAGDLSNDGITDLAIGAPSSSSGMGTVHLYKGTGNTSTASPAIGTQWTAYSQPLAHGIPGADDFGRFVVIGNFDMQNGLSDLAVGAPLKTRDGASEAGAVWLYRNGLTGAPVMLTSDATFTTYLDQEATPQK